ncbi:MAG: SDR family oxidoreductase [Myxococcota bacterium]
MTLQGKRAVITGASRGIGLAIATAFADAGAKVVVSSRNQSVCDEVAKSINGVGIAADVTDEGAVDALFDAVEKRGGCDIFVANAGLAASGFASDVSRADLQAMLDLHYLGALHGAQRAARQMKARGGGAVLFVSSIWGLRGQPSALAYGAAKAALAHAVKVLAIEWARDDIRVNGLAPGFVDTAMTADLDEAVKAKLVSRVPMRRMAEAREMAGPALFLCSDAASYVTGHVLVADGGETAR